MKTLINLEAEQVAQLKDIGAQKGVSRAALIREAIQRYLNDEAAPEKDASFGLWKGRKVDGLSYQNKLREEWER